MDNGRWVGWAVPALALALVGCGSGERASPEPNAPQGRSIETLSGAAVVRRHDPALVALGERVFREHCARCHGDRAQGAPDWRRQLPDGSFPPPPLNGSGHAWHHPRDWLAARIRDGGLKMPAWRGKLSEEEIQAVIEWFQSLWPDPVYAAWYQSQERARGRP